MLVGFEVPEETLPVDRPFMLVGAAEAGVLPLKGEEGVVL